MLQIIQCYFGQGKLLVEEKVDHISLKLVNFLRLLSPNKVVVYFSNDRMN